MDLKKRLASLDRMTRKPLAERSSSPETDRPPPEEIATRELGLVEVQASGGSCFIRNYCDQISSPGETLPDYSGFLSNPGGGKIEAGDVLFLDTETTGLAGGTGTMAFLVGTAWWEGQQFITRQFFLCGPGGESALLRSLHELAGRFKAVATYNGASFDLPLLRTRALLNRLDNPWADLLGWDLLVPARRLWGRRLDNCRQQSIESGICGLARGGHDIEGHLIPQTWFDFLKHGQVDDLHRVLYHNQQDMVGMAHIFLGMTAMARTLELLDSPVDVDWRDAWSLGRIAESRGDGPLSVTWLKRARVSALESDPAAFAEARFVADALRVIKRGGDWPVVENIIACALDCGQNEYWLHREAAILYEHRLVDLDRARQHALATGDEHRLLRLQRKLEYRNSREGSL